MRDGGLSDSIQVTAFQNETGGVTVRLQETVYDGYGFGMNAGGSMGFRWGEPNDTNVGSPDLRDIFKGIRNFLPSLGFDTDFSSLNGTYAMGVPVAITRPENNATRTLRDGQICP